jgi:molybdopterin converting factor small subunit
MGEVATVQVQVRLFGAFRASGSDELTFVVPRGTEVRAVRRRVGEALRARHPGFADDALLAVSALADERRVLDDGEPLGDLADRVCLAILPPVCGG